MPEAKISWQYNLNTTTDESKELVDGLIESLNCNGVEKHEGLIKYAVSSTEFTTT